MFLRCEVQPQSIVRRVASMMIGKQQQISFTFVRNVAKSFSAGKRKLESFALTSAAIWREARRLKNFVLTVVSRSRLSNQRTMFVVLGNAELHDLKLNHGRLESYNSASADNAAKSFGARRLKFFGAVGIFVRSFVGLLQNVLRCRQQRRGFICRYTGVRLGARFLSATATLAKNAVSMVAAYTFTTSLKSEMAEAKT